MTDPLWQPSDERIDSANLTAFMRFLAEDMEGAPADFPALRRWSVEHPQDFWAAFWRFSGVKASRSWDRVLTHPERMPGSGWFEGARLNFAENMLRHRDDQPAHHRLDRRPPPAVGYL